MNLVMSISDKFMSYLTVYNLEYSGFPAETPLLKSYAKSSGGFRVMIAWKYESGAEMFRL